MLDEYMMNDAIIISIGVLQLFTFSLGNVRADTFDCILYTYGHELHAYLRAASWPSSTISKFAQVGQNNIIFDNVNMLERTYWNAAISETTDQKTNMTILFKK